MLDRVIPRKTYTSDWPRRGALAAVASAGAGSVALLWDATEPGTSVLLVALGLLLVVSAVLAWSVLLVIAFATRRTTWHHALVPVIGVLALALLLPNLPMRARWALSRDAFADEVGRLPPAAVEDRFSTRVRGNHRVGLYSVERTAQVHGGGVLFAVTAILPLEYGAFLYLPGPRPLDGRDAYGFSSPAYTELGRSWYAVSGS